MKALARIRRGLGCIFIVAGLVHAGNMTFASLYALRRITAHVSPAAWTRLHFGHFLLLVSCSTLYLGLSFAREKLFYYEALADFLIGIAGFVVVMTLIAALLVAGSVSPWASLVPSIGLIAYGTWLTLRKGDAE